MKQAIIIPFMLLFAVVGRLFSSVDEEIAVVTKVQGMATIRYSTTGTLVSRGYLLMNRSIIRTGTKGMVQIRFVNSGTTVLVRPESELMVTMDRIGAGASEAARLNAGQALFDIHAFYRGTFDIATPAAMVSAEECAALVTYEENSRNSAVFLSAGTCRVADPGFSLWKPYCSPTAVYVTVDNPFLYSSRLGAKDNARLDEFVKAARSMKIMGPITHSLVIKNDSGGTVLPGKSMTALQGYPVDMVAKPTSGFAFMCWEVLGGAAIITNPAAESTTVTVSSDAQIAARFTDSPTKLVVHAEGPGKTVPIGLTVIPRKYLWKIAALPFFGYALKKWDTSEGIKLMSQDSASATIIANIPEGRVTAEFVKRDFSCTVKSTDGGSVKPGGEQKLVSGSLVNIVAAPSRGYTFISWNIVKGRARIANPYEAVTTLQIDSSDVEIRARFHKTGKTSVIAINPHERATIEPFGTIAVPVGEPFTITTKPQAGYEIEKWVVRLGEADIKGTEHAIVRSRVKSEIVPVIITKRYSLTMCATGPGKVAPAGTSKLFYGTPCTIVATPEPGKVFACWQELGGNAVVGNKLAAQTTVTLSSTDAVISAEFATALGKVTVDATAGGYTEPAGAQVMYEGKVIGIKAIPNPRAAFLGWSLEPAEKILDFSDTITAREQIITMRKVGDVRLTARFSTETVELSVLSNGLGTTEPAKTVWVPQDQWIPLKAAPAEGNTFVQWVTVTGSYVDIRDKFSAETEVKPGTRNATIRALFASSEQPAEPDRETVGGPLTLTATADVNEGAIEPAGPVTLQPGIPVTLTATAAPQYYFIEWVVTDGNAVIADRYNRTTTITPVQRSTEIEARFALRTLQVIETEFVDPVGQRKTIIIQYR